MQTLPDGGGDFNPRPLFECFSRTDCERLYRHLHNDNGPHDFVMGFRDGEGKKQYKHSKTVPVKQEISWSLSTTAGESSKKTAFVPYASDDNGESVWSGMDFDAHDGNTERASRLAHAALPLVREIPHTYAILEESGSGGFHLWCIAEGFRPVDWWYGNLLAVAQRIGTPLQEGICELRPLSPKASCGSKAYGMRAPGAWNPDTERCSLILWHDIDPLLATLTAKEAVLGEREKKSRKPFYPLGQLSEKHEEWYRHYPIVEPGTRHKLLCGLVGRIFYQVARPVALDNAVAQYRAKSVVTNADEAEHVEEFHEAWEGMLAQWMPTLTAYESAIFGQLVTPAERDGFRILRGWQTLAIGRGESDFALSPHSLGARLRMTRQGASAMVERFETLGAMVKTLAYLPHERSAHYRWLSTF